MSERPEDLFRRAAARPDQEPDLAALRARARRRRALRRGGATLSVVAVLAVGSAAALTLDAGGGEQVALDDPATPASPSPDVSPAATPLPDPDAADPDGEPGDEGDDADGAEFDGDTAPVEEPGAENQQMAVLSQVRVGAHDGFDRVVWEFSQGDRPRVRVEYVDEPTQPGSGHAVEVAGGASLRLLAEFATDRGAELHAPDADAYAGPSRIDGGAADVVEEVVALGDFEANLQWAIGVDRERPFRVMVLEDPLRIVVDIAH